MCEESPDISTKAGFGSVSDICRTAERSSIQLLSRPYRPRLRSPEPSSTALHCSGSAAANWSTNRGSAIGSKCRSDITRTCPAIAGAGAVCCPLAVPQSCNASATAAPYRQAIDRRARNSVNMASRPGLEPAI
jgi:hypothetical protein